MKGKLLIFTILSAFAVMALAVTASAGNGNPPNGKGGNPPSGPGNVCQPGYHGEPAGSNNCVHNGDGAGNCDQNQSNNTGNGAGNGGNDYGDGHKGDKCDGPKPPPECKGDNCHPQPPPRGQCPEGYSEDPGSTPKVLLCTRTVTVTNTITNTVEVPGPTQTVVQTVYGNPQCPAGSTETSRGQGMVVCQIPGPERVVEKVVERTRIVYGTPKCPAGFKKSKAGKGWVACTKTVVRNKTKTIVKVRVVSKPKPAYTK